MERTVIKTLDELCDWFIFPYPIIAFDTEATSLDYMSNELVGMSFCSGTTICYIDIIDNPEKDNILSFIRNLFEEEFTYLIAHNIPFDLKLLSKYNIHPKEDATLFCTQTAAHLVDETAPKNLNDLVARYYRVNLGTWEEASKNGYHSDKFYQYGMDDAKYAYLLHKVLLPKLKVDGCEYLYFNIEGPFQRVIVDLEKDGVLISKDKLAKLQEELNLILFKLQIDLCESAGIDYVIQPHLYDDEREIIPAVNFNSSKQVAKVIQDTLGIEITEKTKKGAPSVNKESLKSLKGLHKFIDILRIYNLSSTLNDSYVSKFGNYICDDGRVRCNWNNTIAVTGRLTASKPGLAKLPRKDADIKIPFEFRSCFIPPKGKKIVCADFAGQEICWLGEVTKDENLINAIKNKKDLHLTTAKKIFDLPIPDQCLYTDHHDYEKFKKKYKEQRHIGKNAINFPLIYGKTAFGISRTFNIPEKEAQKWLDSFFELYPDVKRTIDKCHRKVDKDKSVRDWFGRVRRFDEDVNKYEAYRQSFNFLIQAPSASQLKKASIAVRNLFRNKPEWDAKIVLMIYDEIVYEIKEEYAEESKYLVKELMENAIETNVPFTVEIGIGDNYAEAK